MQYYELVITIIIKGRPWYNGIYINGNFNDDILWYIMAYG